MQNAPAGQVRQAKCLGQQLLKVLRLFRIKREMPIGGARKNWAGRDVCATLALLIQQCGHARAERILFGRFREDEPVPRRGGRRSRPACLWLPCHLIQPFVKRVGGRGFGAQGVSMREGLCG